MSQKIQNVNVEVNMGYKPDVINFKFGVPAQITFTRTNAKGCLNTVQSKDLGFKKALPVNQPQVVKIPTNQKGEFKFFCTMKMFSGKVVIK